MQLTVKVGFSWSHHGVEVQHYAVGDEIDTEDADLIQVSTREGWTVAKGENKALAASPKNKAHKTSMTDRIKNS